MLPIGRTIAGGAHLFERPAGETDISAGLICGEKRAFLLCLIRIGGREMIGVHFLPAFPLGLGWRNGRIAR